MMVKESGWLPTAEEVNQEILQTAGTLEDYCNEAVKFTAKKIAERGNEPCPHSLPDFDADSASPNTSKLLGTQYPKHVCDLCWQELLREIEES